MSKWACRGHSVEKYNRRNLYSCCLSNINFKIELTIDDIRKENPMKKTIRLKNNGKESLPQIFIFTNDKSNTINFIGKPFYYNKRILPFEEFDYELELLFPYDIIPDIYIITGKLLIDNIGEFDGFSFCIDVMEAKKIKVVNQYEPCIKENEEKKKFSQSLYLTNNRLNLCESKNKRSNEYTKYFINSTNANNTDLNDSFRKQFHNKDNNLQRESNVKKKNNTNCVIIRNDLNKKEEKYENSIDKIKEENIVLNQKILLIEIEKQNQEKKYINLINQYKQDNIIKNEQYNYILKEKTELENKVQQNKEEKINLLNEIKRLNEENNKLKNEIQILSKENENNIQLIKQIQNQNQIKNSFFLLNNH